MDLLEQYIINQLGFKDKEIEAIISHFFCSLNQYDWESIELNNEVGLDEFEVIEDYDNYLKLSTGRIAYFPDDLLHKDHLAQVD